MTLVDSVLGVWQLKPRVKIYYDWVTIKYVCDADIWSKLNDATRKIRKIERDMVTHSENTTLASWWEYNNKATDLTTVKNHIYS